MPRTKILAALFTCLAGAAGAATVDDGNGREWRQVVDTTGLTWNQVATVCPQDGVTPCLGSVGGRSFDRWVWATQLQTMELMNRYLPDNPALPNNGKLSPEYPSVGGMGYWFVAQEFPFAPTFSFTMNGAPYLSSTQITGFTSTLAAPGSAIQASVGFGNSPVSIDGGFTVGITAGTATLPQTPVGFWLWRPIGPDYTPPVITYQLSGQLGSGGWYVSDVSLDWIVDEPGSPVVLTGCEPAAITEDTAGTTFSCEAVSEGGAASRSVQVRRDATPPALTCGPTPSFELGEPFAQVTATVADALSGPLASQVFAGASTGSAGSFSATLTGHDRAGNAKTRSCPYRVVVPTCHGLAPTLLGTGASNVLTGTPGPDVIHGLAGNDVIDGGGGDDVICGGDGDDDISGGDGDDDLDGGLGYDGIRGDDGSDNCVSGEARMSSCATYDEYSGGGSSGGGSSGPSCGIGPELAAVFAALAALCRRRAARAPAASESFMRSV